MKKLVFAHLGPHKEEVDLTIRFYGDHSLAGTVMNWLLDKNRLSNGPREVRFNVTVKEVVFLTKDGQLDWDKFLKDMAETVNHNYMQVCVYLEEKTPQS
jgi:hypothetical protein